MAEVVAAVADLATPKARITVTTIEGGATVRLDVRGIEPVDAAWLRSPTGLHRAVVGDGALYVDPPLPPPPAPVILVLVSAGTAVELDLR
jgi:hypothetical protein